MYNCCVLKLWRKKQVNKPICTLAQALQGFKIALARGRGLTPKAVAWLARDTLDRLSGVVIAKLSCNNVVWFGI